MVISEMTLDKVGKEIEARYLDRIQVVGKEQPIKVFELLSRKGQLTSVQKEINETYNKGIDLFLKREWEKARTVFKSVLKISKEDGPSKTYIERCTTFIDKPPSKNWNGVYKMSAK
jgi:adenylate cyclase